MEGKKISFGFMKTKKADKPVVEEQKQFIECVEEKSIKVVGGEEIIDNTPLVIPMKPNTLVTAERLKEIAEKVESALVEPENDETPPSPIKTETKNETLEQMAVRELLENSKKENKVETAKLTVTLPPKSVTVGEKESTLQDYESVPIQEFGMAMLRGMGWTQNNEKSKYKQPQLRPKGLGLGADKVIKENQKKKLSSNDNKDEDLAIVKNAYVKITSGKHSGYYGKVVSLDEDNGRVMVDITVKKETVSLSEFMMHPVTKAEFDKESKVINANTYEEYKKNENSAKTSSKTDTTKSNDRNSQKDNSRPDRSKNRENDTESSSKRDQYDKRDRDRDRSNRDRYRRDPSEEKIDRKKQAKRYSSNESLDSDIDKNRYKKKERKRYSSSDSLKSLSDTDKRNKNKERRRSSSESDHRSKKEGKRDIDKKRKGKKKKRDRDRSPNYRKHRK